MKRKVLIIFGALDAAQKPSLWLIIDSACPTPRYCTEEDPLPIISKNDEVEFWCFDPNANGSVTFDYVGTDAYFIGIDGLVEDKTEIRLNKAYTAIAKVRGLSQYTEVSASWNTERFGAGNMKGKLYGTGPNGDPP